MKTRIISAIAALVLVTAIPVPSRALDFDFSGTFQQDNDVVLLNFTVAAAGPVTIFTSSWDDGGFDPILHIFDATGSWEYNQDDGGTSGVADSNGVSYTYGDWDIFWTELFIPAGSWIASITQWDNRLAGRNYLNEGFTYDNDPHFTFTQALGPQPDFNGINDARTGEWSAHILGVDAASGSTAVPEPSTLLLLGTGFLGLAVLRRGRKG